jgi:hypothetical protein
LQTGKEGQGLRDASLQRARGGARHVGLRPAELELAEVHVGALDEAEDGVRVLEHDLAGVGQRHRAASFRPLDQPVADAPLEDGDLLADRRLGEAEARGRAAERPLAGNRPQRREVAQLDAGPGTEGAERSGAAFVAAGVQPPFCFPPAWVCAISKEPAISRG